jgi:ketosteroid isomerase-like protein
MSQENVALVQRFYQQYFTTGKLPSELLDEDCEVHDHDTPDQGVYRGIAGAERWLEDWNDAWAEWSIEPEEFIDATDCVVVVVRMRAKGAHSGLELDRQDAVVYRVRDHKLLRADYYNNKAQALEAAGLSE